MKDPVIVLSGGPGAPSLVNAETLVANPQIHAIVVARVWQIAMLYPNARNVVFRNAVHGQVELADFPSASVDEYRVCALRLARQFLADPVGPLETRCAETRSLRLVP